MLSVAVQKDISDYKPKFFGKMTGRMLACSACAVGITVGFALWIYFILGLNPSNLGIFLMLPSVPFWLLAFFKRDDMRLEKWLPKFLNSKFSKEYLTYKSWACMNGFYSHEKHEEKNKKDMINGYEGYSF